MPLTKQNIPVPLGAGLDEKVDQRLLPPGKVTNIVNGVFTRLGAIEKRNGNTALPGASASLLSPMQSLFPFGDELLGIDQAGHSLFSWAPNAGQFASIDSVPEPTVTRRSILQNVTDMGSADVAYCNGIQFFAWVGDSVDSGTGFKIGNIYYSAIDAETGASIISPTRSAVNTTVGNNLNPKLTTVGDYVVLTAADYNASFVSGSVKAQSFHVTKGNVPTNSATAFLTSGTLGAFSICWDVCGYTTGSTGTLFLSFGSITSSLNWRPFDPRTLAPTHALTSRAPDAGYSIFVVGNSVASSAGTVHLNNIWSLSDATTSKVNLQVVNGDSNSMAELGVGTVTSYADPAAGNVSFYVGCVSPLNDLNKIYNIWQTHFSAPSLLDYPVANSRQMKYNAGSITGTTKLLSGTVNIALNSRPFISGSRCFALGNLKSEVQGTQYILDTVQTDEFGSSNYDLYWRPVATIAPRQTNIPLNGITRNVGCLGNVFQTPAENHWFTLGSVEQSQQSTSRQGVQLLDIDFTTGSHFQSVVVGNNVHVSTGTPSYFDGLNVGEIGFCQFPENVQFIPSLTGGFVSAGVYQYAVVYEWIDAKGQLHQSAPSIQTGVTVSSVAGITGSVLLRIPCLTLSNRFVPLPQNFPSPVSIAIYRSVANGTVLHRLTPDTAPASLFNVPGKQYIEYTDATNDVSSGSLSTHAVLYTEGGVLPHFNPPSAKYVCSNANRVWFAGMDDPKAVWYSNAFVPGEAVSFNDELSFTVDEGGDITGIAGLEERLVIFKADRLFYVAGQGPDELGNQNDLSNPVRIPSDVGCINAKSIVETGDGLMFQSDIGFHLLSRAFEVSNVGFPMVDTIQAFPTITSAVLHPIKTEVRFTGIDASTGKGMSMVYDYLAKAWTTFGYYDPAQPFGSPLLDRCGVTSACAKGNDYFWSSIKGSVSVESRDEDNHYIDGLTSFGGYYPMTVESSWVSLNDLQGFQRVWRAMVVGQQFDQCNVTVSLGTDYNDAYDQIVPFFSGTLNGPNLPLQLEVHVGKQKCQAMRIKVQDSLPFAGIDALVNGGRGIQLTRATLRAGVKEGLQKLPPRLRS